MEELILPAEGTPLRLALNQALGGYRTEAARQRYRSQGGMDSKRQNTWDSFGWNKNPVFEDFYRLWERGGLAHGAVCRVNSKCWENEPEIIQGDEDKKDKPRTAWEKSFAKFAKLNKLWEVVREADMRRTVGHYSGLVLQIADGKTWQSPVNARGVRRLVKIIPAWEGQLYPTEYDTDETSPTYGEPKMYTFDEGAVGSQTNRAQAAYMGRKVQIHPDRVVILGDLLNGVPMLRAGYNDFSNLEKILGGSGESFLKNAARQLAIEFEKEVDLEDIAHAHNVDTKDLRKIYDGVTRGLNQGIDQTIVTQAAKVTPLVANVPDPEKHFEASLMSAAASIMIPVMVWIGSQTGERSSSEDQKDWAKTCQGRRVRVLSSDLETLVRRLMQLKLIEPVEDFTVVWSDLSEATQKEKLENGKLMSEINEKSAISGELVYSNDEIRTATGHTNQGVSPTPLPEAEPEPEPNDKEAQQ